jgi:hypothetical protein
MGDIERWTAYRGSVDRSDHHRRFAPAHEEGASGGYAAPMKQIVTRMLTRMFEGTRQSLHSADLTLVVLTESLWLR